MLGVNYDKAAVRRTRQELAAKVRNDWEVVLEHGLDSPSVASESEDEDFIRPPKTATSWRERTYASSDPSSGEGTEDESVSRRPFLTKPTSGNGGRSLNAGAAFMGHHCMFPGGSDGDGDGDSSTDHSRDREANATRKRQERKRRRRRRLEEEMAWNEGLRNWEQTRDLWCRAKKAPGKAQPQPQSSTSNSPDLASSPETTNTSATSSVGDEHAGDRDVGLALKKMKLSSTDHTIQTSPRISSPLTTTLIPLTAPMIPPSDPGRQNITSQYSIIFNKVVIEGLRPQVPINLSHMIRALVKGWKDNDEWPPKPDPKEARPPGRRGKNEGTGEWFARRQREKSGTFEGIKEGGRRLLGLPSNGSKDAHQTPTTMPADQRRRRHTEGDVSKRRSDINKRIADVNERNSTETVAEAEVNSPTTPPNSSPRNSTEQEKGSPLHMRKNVARVRRSLRNSIGGGSSGTGTSGTGEEKL